MDDHTLRQLALIKLVFERTEKLLNTKPLDDGALVMSTIMLDFTVEMLLKRILLEKSNLGDNKIFNKNFDNALQSVADLVAANNWFANGIIAEHRQLQSLHRSRNDVQHKGDLPNVTELRDLFAFVRSFIHETYKIIFVTEFQEVSLVNLIKDDTIRHLLKNAYVDLDKGDFINALEHSAKALTHLLGILHVPSAQSGASQNFRLEDILDRYYQHVDIVGIEDDTLRQTLRNVMDEYDELQKSRFLFIANLAFTTQAGFDANIFANRNKYYRVFHDYDTIFITRDQYAKNIDHEYTFAAIKYAEDLALKLTID